MQIFDLTCLSLTSITFERIELQSSDWTQKTRFFKLYPNMLSVHFDIILMCSFSGEKLKFVFFLLKLYRGAPSRVTKTTKNGHTVKSRYNGFQGTGENHPLLPKSVIAKMTMVD